MGFRSAVRSGSWIAVCIGVLTLLASGCTSGSGAGSNAAPGIGAIPDARTPRGDVVEVQFTIVDENPDTVTVVASSSDQTLVADSDIEVLGSGANRTLRITPATLGTGNVDITLVARDAAGLEGVRSFGLEVAIPFQTQFPKLTASDADDHDRLGTSVSIDGEYAIVGTRGIGAYMFRRSGDVWTEVDVLAASDGTAGDQFGFSVAISGDYAIVGAYFDDLSGTHMGSAYIFRRSGDDWTEIDKLTASDGADFDQFGQSVAISGDYAIVGAPFHDVSGTDEGAAYVFRRSGDDWIEIDQLAASDGATSDQFGKAVSISGDYAIVGADLDDHASTTDGSAYVFRRGGDAWSEIAKLTASDGAAGDQFGFSVAISGDYAVVGAPVASASAINDGSAYVFQRSGDVWTEIDKLTASDAADDDRLGWSVAIHGNYAIVGAPRDEDSGTDEGSAYVFRRSGTVWTEIEELTAGDAADSDQFGYSVAISGEYAIVGAYEDDLAGTNEGSAYVFPK